jgi:CHAT domain-containing protein
MELDMLRISCFKLLLYYSVRASRVGFFICCIGYANLTFAEDSLRSQAVKAYKNYSFIEAATLFEQSIAVYERDLGAEHPKTLEATVDLANVYRDMGRRQEALKLIKSVVDIRIRLLGPEDLLTLSAMQDLGTALSKLGRFREAFQMTEQVFQLRSRILGEKHKQTLMSMASLASLYEQLGDTSKQLELSEKFLSIAEETYGENASITMIAMSRLASSYKMLNRGKDQVKLLERLLGLRKKLLGPEHKDTLQSMNNLGLAYMRLGQRKKSLELLRQTLEFKTKKVGSRHPDLVSTINNLALTLLSIGEVDEALPLFEQSASLCQEFLGLEHPSCLTADSNLAQTYFRSGRSTEALALFERTLSARIKVSGANHADSLTLLYRYAVALESVGMKGEALALAPRFVAGAEWQRSQPGLSLENRQTLFQQYAERYRWFSLRYGANGDIDQGLRLSELSKARTLLESMATQFANRAGVLPAEEQEALEDLNLEVESLSEELAKSESFQKKQTIESKINELSRRYAKLQNELVKKYPKYGQLNDVKILGSADVPGLIPSGSVFISFVVTAKSTGCYVANSEGDITYIDLGAIPRLSDAVEIFRRAHASGGMFVDSLAEDGKRAWRLAEGGYLIQDISKSVPEGASPLDNAAEVGDFLARHLLTPLSPLLSGQQRWIVSPDGPLAQLPFEALPWQASGQLVVSVADIHYTQSLSVFSLSRTLQQKYQSLSERLPLMAMGNPLYGKGEKPDSERGRLARTIQIQDNDQLAGLDPMWNDLPGTEKEIRAVAALYDDKASVYSGARASEQQLQALRQSGELKNYRYLLFSAHGYLSSDKPALSSIVLSLKDRTPKADGYVTASEWPGYELQSDLLVLSACNSGVGKNLSGEGVMGLPFALFVAGNVNTLLTLWPIDDEASAIFITHFFTRLKEGLSAGAALASAKREFLRSGKYRDPKYWAAFILVGAG